MHADQLCLRHESSKPVVGRPVNGPKDAAYSVSRFWGFPRACQVLETHSWERRDHTPTASKDEDPKNLMVNYVLYTLGDDDLPPPSPRRRRQPRRRRH